MIILGCYATTLYNDIEGGNIVLIVLSFIAVILGSLVTPICIVPLSTLKTMRAKTFSRLSSFAALFLLYHMLSSIFLFTFGLSCPVNVLHEQLVLSLRITAVSLIAFLNFYLVCAMRQLKTLAGLRDVSVKCTNKLNHLLATQPELCTMIVQAMDEER